MILSRLTLTPQALRSGNVRSALRYGAYGHHQLLMAAYGDTGARLLFRQEGDTPDGLLRFLVLAPAEPQDAGIEHFQAEHKAFAPQLQQGDRLAFSIRVNPVAARREAGARRGKRRDVVYEALLAERKKGNHEEDYRPHLAQREGCSWLQPRLEHAGLTIEADSLRCDGYQRRQTNRKGIVFSTLDCAGIGTVTNPESMINAIAAGIGPAKGFGCGLLLIRRA